MIKTRSAVFILTACLLALQALPVSAQEWARKMFQEQSHDFGTVARSAKVQYSFVLQNIYKEDIHIAGVRSSCGCTTPTITKDTLKTWETSEVVATFNTHSFLGQRRATLTVTIDKPFYAEVQLNVSGNIRGDIEFDPGSINFGEVQQGSESSENVRVSHMGGSNWRITDIRSANEHFEVELGDPRYDGRGVTYEMTVKMKPSMPPGFLNDQLLLVTNDTYGRTIPVSVEGRVLSPIEVSPSVVFMGVLEEGETASKRLIVRGKRPFRIVSVECEGDCLEFNFDPAAAKTTHLVPVTFKASKAGVFEQKIRIQTDFNEGLETAVTARADVKAKAGE